MSHTFTKLEYHSPFPGPPPQLSNSDTSPSPNGMPHLPNGMPHATHPRQMERNTPSKWNVHLAKGLTRMECYAHSPKGMPHAVTNGMSDTLSTGNLTPSPKWNATHSPNGIPHTLRSRPRDGVGKKVHLSFLRSQELAKWCRLFFTFVALSS